MFVVNGILFNHESPRRGETFVTRKITRAVARIAAGQEQYVYMGNLDAVRDWGYAPEYVEGMWRMLQADEPDDYVLATGEAYTVRDFLVIAFEHAGLNWEDHVRFDDRYLRPTEVDSLIGNALKAERKLGWKPLVHTPELARIMVDADREALKHAGGQWIDTPDVASWRFHD
jgi:GDPmannose 4,6-dehydratase